MSETVQIIHPVRVGHALLIGAVLHRFLETGVQVADLRDDFDDAFAVQIDDEPQNAVRRGVLRPDVEAHVLGLKGTARFGLLRRRVGYETNLSHRHCPLSPEVLCKSGSA